MLDLSDGKRREVTGDESKGAWFGSITPLVDELIGEPSSNKAAKGLSNDFPDIRE